MVMNKYFPGVLKSLESETTLCLSSMKHKSLTIEYEKAAFQEKDVDFNSQEPLLPFANSEIYEANISDWRRLSAENNTKPIYEVSLTTQNSRGNPATMGHLMLTNTVVQEECPGDTIGIIPKNKREEVETIINHLGLNDVADLCYILSVDSDCKGAKLPVHLPRKASIRHTLTHYVDVRGLIKKAFLLALSKYTKEPSEIKILQYICSKEGSMMYTAHVLNKKLCILDLFAIFKSCKPPVEVVLEHLPRLLPRPYSVCSSSLINPGKLKVCFSVQDIGNERKGLTTAWLEELLTIHTGVERRMEQLSLTNNVKIPIYFRKNISEFRMPKDLSVSIILIGHGTGISPFIGFLEEREYLISNKSEGTQLGYSWLLNGCRNPQLDFIYELELKKFLQKKVLNRMNTAFSRIEDRKSFYVQDLIREYGEDLSRLIVNGAFIFVSGDLNAMMKEVRVTITECLQKFTFKTQEEATQYLSVLERERRYIVDAWN